MVLTYDTHLSPQLDRGALFFDGLDMCGLDGDLKTCCADVLYRTCLDFRPVAIRPWSAEVA